jgi:hypothetical protein
MVNGIFMATLCAVLVATVSIETWSWEEDQYFVDNERVVCCDLSTFGTRCTLATWSVLLVSPVTVWDVMLGGFQS